MPWWSWIVVWGSLALCALAVFVWLGYRIVIKAVAVLRGLGDLADKADLLHTRTEEIVAAHGPSAVFTDPRQIAEQRNIERAARAHWRQTRREARVRQGKILVNADPQRLSHLLKRT